MSEAKIIEQGAERFFADGSFADMLMAVELGSARRFGVVAMNNLHVVQGNGCVEMLKRCVNAFFGDDIVSSDVSVTSVDAGGSGDDTPETVDDFGDLLKAPSQ